MVRNPKPYKWFIYGYGLVGQNIRPCTPLERRRERRLYISICGIQLIAIKTDVMQEVNAISDWQTRKEICLVNNYHSHFLQGICADRLYHITYLVSTPLIEIKNNNGFDMPLILSQLLFLICN